MKDFAFTNNIIAYNNHIFRYYKADNEKELLQRIIKWNEDFKECKIIKKPKDVILKWGAKYCFEYKSAYYYCYEI